MISMKGFGAGNVHQHIALVGLSFPIVIKVLREK